MNNTKILLPFMALSLTLVGCGNGGNTSAATTTTENTSAATTTTENTSAAATTESAQTSEATATTEEAQTTEAVQTSDSSASSESAQTEQTSTDPYKINEVDYLLLKSSMCSPRVFLTSNFTFEINGLISKIDNGKFDGVVQGDRLVYSFDPETYNVSTTEVNSYEFEFDDDELVWYRTQTLVSLNQLHSVTGLYLLQALPSAYDDLSFNESKHQYTASVNMEGDDFNVNFKIEDGKLAFFKIGNTDGSMMLEFSDYGTTSVNLPKDYVDAKE